MNKTLSALGCLAVCLASNAQTDAYIKLFDHHGKHPRIVGITYPGDADNLDMYNSLYGHGAVIENPFVAYRVYMDNRQSIDLYVKQTPRLELETTGFYTTAGQLAEGYGCDVLWVGKSVGAGSFRGWQEEKPTYIDTVATRTQRVLSNRCVEVIDSGWVYNGHPVNLVQTLTVEPDSRHLWVRVYLENYLPGDLFCTGVQKLENHGEGFIDPTGIAASRGSNIPDKSCPELVEEVGLAITVDPANIVEIREDDDNYLFIVRPDDNGFIRYRVTSAGSREKNGFNSGTRWLEYARTLL